MQCLICHEIMEDNEPYSTIDALNESAFKYHKNCLQDWFQTKDRGIICGEPVPSYSNYTFDGKLSEKIFVKQLLKKSDDSVEIVDVENVYTDIYQNTYLADHSEYMLELENDIHINDQIENQANKSNFYKKLLWISLIVFIVCVVMFVIGYFIL